MDDRKSQVPVALDAQRIVNARALLAPKEVARLIGVSPRTIARGIRSGEIPSVRLRRCRRIPASFVRGLGAPKDQDD
jgi:excisionase family DNA binding protein